MNSVTQLPLWGTIEIPLTKGYVAIVDAVDGDLAQFKWCAFETRGIAYAVRGKNDRLILMHRVVVSRVANRVLAESEHVDHKDRNGLNNCRENLRLCTPAQNHQNQKRAVNNTSGYKGVYFHKLSGKWMARIMENKTLHYLGLFESPEAAYAAYCEAAVKYHGEFARLE